jgi:GNAT superfamily N-acetyltransferase
MRSKRPDALGQVPDILIRRAAPADALGVARVHIRSWQEGYKALLPGAYLDALSVEERAQRYTFANLDSSAPTTFVLEADASICGFATTAPARDADVVGLGELAALYVHPDSWGQGFGAALVAAARQHLKSSGFDQAVLWVLSGNVRAERFYRQDGWAAEGQTRRSMRGGIEIEEQRFRRPL